MSDTPRTDAAVFLTIAPGHNSVDPNFARTLERELAEANKHNDQLQLEKDTSWHSEELEDLQRELENLLRDAKHDGEIIERKCEQLAEAKRDSARLDWLDRNAVLRGYTLAIMERGEGDALRWAGIEWSGEAGDEIRAAIDAAMEAST